MPIGFDLFKSNQWIGLILQKRLCRMASHASMRKSRLKRYQPLESIHYMYTDFVKDLTHSFHCLIKYILVVQDDSHRLTNIWHAGEYYYNVRNFQILMTRRKEGYIMAATAAWYCEYEKAFSFTNSTLHNILRHIRLWKSWQIKLNGINGDAELLR